jgi:hypothetical protein
VYRQYEILALDLAGKEIGVAQRQLDVLSWVRLSWSDALEAAPDLASELLK